MGFKNRNRRSKLVDVFYVCIYSLNHNFWFNFLKSFNYNNINAILKQISLYKKVHLAYYHPHGRDGGQIIHFG